MMKRWILMLWVLVTALATWAITNDDVQQAAALAQRLSPTLASKVEFHKIEADKDVFTLEGKGGKVVIGGNNSNSMAVGLNRYLNRYCKTTVSWYADVPVELPKVLPDVSVSEQVTARVPQRFFLNYCTWGYTMPFWQWNDWALKLKKIMPKCYKNDLFL